jgi:hypothetical protein
MNDKMTVNQRNALECLRQAGEHGMALSAYARKRGFNERQIYDAIAALRRNGTLPAPGSTRPSARSDFVAVRIAPPSTSSSVLPDSAVCHVRVGNARITCQQWPPAAWLATLGQAGLDAATPEH